MWARKEHLKLWKILSEHMFAKSTVDQQSQALTKSFLSVGRKKIRLAISLLTGHGHLRKHFLRELDYSRRNPYADSVGV